MTKHILKLEVVDYIKTNSTLILALSDINEVSYSTIRQNWMYDCRKKGILTNLSSLKLILEFLQADPNSPYKSVEDLCEPLSVPFVNEMASSSSEL